MEPVHPHPPDRPSHRPTGASLVALIAVGVTFTGMAVLHLVRPDLNPLRDVMSHYANGSRGPVMSIVFYAFGACALALAVRLRTAVDHRGPARAFPALLAAAGLGLIVAGVFEVDRPDAPHTVQESIHSNAAVIAFVLLVLAMFLFSVACWRDPRWRSVRAVSLALAVVAAGAAVATQLGRATGSSGAVQRILAGVVLAWFALTAVHVRRRSFGAS